jgi:hypothetical protein
MATTHRSTTFARRLRHLGVAIIASAGVMVATSPSALAFTSAPHTQLPDLKPFDYVGGRPLRVITFVKADGHPANPSTFASRVIWFGRALVRSHWYDAASSFYGFGADGVSGSLRVTNMPVADSAMTAQKLTNKIRGWVTQMKLPKNPNVRTIFVVYLPCIRGTTWGIAKCPVSFHPQLVLNSPDANFTAGDGIAVVHLPTDTTPKVDSATLTATHELIEAATDTGNGWHIHTATPNNPFDVTPWIYNENQNGNTEVMDMAGGSRITEHFSDAVHGYDYRYERVFTNRAANANRDPFVPASPLGYASVTNGTNGWVKQSSARATHRITMTAWSTKPVSSWKVSTSMAAWKGGPSSTDKCSAALSRTSVNNGTAVTLTIHYNGSPTNRYWCVVKVKSTTAGASLTGTRNDSFRQWLVGLRLEPPA